MATNQTTKIADLINPQVMADMISAKVEKKIVVAPFAKVDNTLVGVPGNTITVPKYGYIGDAEDIAEGVACGTVKLQTGTTTATVKKAMKAVELTDEAVLSGYGNPVGSAAVISYNSVVDAIDLFDEEVNSEKVMFVNPKQVTQLRKDTNFISADKYTGKVIMTGEIGMIANCRIVPSKKVKQVEVGETTKVKCYACPIVKLNNDAETEEDASAITVYLKKDTSVETERESLSRKTNISVDKHYTVALTNESKVVLAKIKA